MMQLRKPRCHIQISRWLKVRIIASLIVLFASCNSFAESEILSLEGARIRGNQELPNVLYLIPWKPPKIYSLDKAETTLSSSPNLEMLDRSSFKRLLNYHHVFKGKADKPKNKKKSTLVEN